MGVVRATRTRVLLIVGVAGLVTALGIGALRYRRAERQRAAEGIAAVQRLGQDVRLTAVMDTLREAGRSGRIVVTDVNVVDPVAGAVVAHQTVRVEDGRIAWVGAAGDAPAPADATVIDGRGRYLSPGLTDVHVHTEDVGQHVLRLAAGVTTVREMDGFPWLLRTRDAVASGVMIGATMYVAGTIIADQPLGGYAVVAHTPEDARVLVRNQAKCGYAFIKVHNSLATPLFDAVAEEAHKQGLDLIGHVPHGISLAHAVHSGRMRTLEHLKGFLIDQTLLPSDEAYAPALAGAEVWIAPSLYTRIDRAYGDEARRLAADPRQRFVPRARRDDWLANLPAEGSVDARLHDTLTRTQASVMARLLPLDPHWLVGTDAAGYMFNIAGFAALDELVLLRGAGLAAAAVVRAATSEPAVALRRTGEFGRIMQGQRADLVLLEDNPLETVAAYQSNLGVMARGRWYDRASLDAALESVAQIYDAPIPDRLDPAAANTLAAAVQSRARAGFVFEDRILIAAAGAFTRTGAPAAAQSMRQLVSAPTTGACAADTPG
jgi:cytosine/adenosine deaminase-related metal-dependent hydrolase